jgi:hypothetical protein
MSTIELDDDPFFEVNGRIECDHESALALLLADEVVFANEREYLWEDKSRGRTVVLYVLCNDVFAWGCADTEDLPLSEVGNLYRMHRADPRYGATKWCCLRRNERPQKPVERGMRELGAWDEAMEALPLNGYEQIVAEHRKAKQA